MREFRRAPGALLEPIGDVWAAFSPLSGESHLLNNESAAILELLDVEQARSHAEVCEVLARECDLLPSDLDKTVANAWPQLLEAGLVREQLSLPATSGDST